MRFFTALLIGLCLVFHLAAATPLPEPKHKKKYHKALVHEHPKIEDMTTLPCGVCAHVNTTEYNSCPGANMVQLDCSHKEAHEHLDIESMSRH